MGALTGGPGRPARILGVGAYRPRHVVTTDEVAARLGTTPDWAISRTGVLRRCRAVEDETLVAMAAAAAAKAVSASGRHGSDVDFVLVATMTNPQPTPAIAPRLADALGTSAAALDVNAACAGFLFGDGAGAVVVGTAREPGISPAVWGSAGSRSAALEVRPDCFTVAADPSRGRPWLRMDGTAVARWVATTVPAAITAALEHARVSWRDVAAFVPHQASQRVIARIVNALEVPEHVVVADDCRDMGNTSSASVPLALARLLDAGRVRPGDVAALVGFGAGMAYTGQVVRIP